MGVSDVLKHTELADKEVVGVIDHAVVSVTTEKLADGVLSADAAGRAKMADGFVTSAKVEKDADLDIGSGGFLATKTLTRFYFVPISMFGKDKDPPVADIFGICYVLKFAVGTSKAYYKFHVPTDWVPGTDVLVHTHWTRSTTGSDESGKTVKWQMKYLVADGKTENVNAGEVALSVQDTYDSTSTTDQVVHQTDSVVIPASAISSGDCIVIELMAITPTGTALSTPAIAALGATYTAYQVVSP